MEPALYPAPLGLDATMEEPTEVEIEIENPEGVRIGMDGLEIEIEPGKDNEGEEFDSNLAEFMDEGIPPNSSSIPRGAAYKLFSIELVAIINP